MRFAVSHAADAEAVSAKAATPAKEVLIVMSVATFKTAGVLALLPGLLLGGGAALGRVRASAVESARVGASDASDDGDAKQLQGTWYTLSVESHGRKVPPERILAKGVRLVVEGDRWTLKEAEGDPDKEFSVRLDPAKKPAAVDIVYRTGANKGKTSLGIYELGGGTFRVCVAEPGEPRPTKFSGGGADTLEVFGREKPKPPKPAPGGSD